MYRLLVACALLAAAPPVAASQTHPDAREDSAGIEADRSVPGEPETATVAQAREALTAREKRRRDKDARRRALLCERWTRGHLVHYFRRAATVDVAQCLKAGASVTMRDRQGGLPLHAAAEATRDADVISLLVEAGADVMARTGDRLNDTPLHRAARHNPNVDVAARLIDLGAELNARNADRWQPLHMAAQANRNPAIADLLVERGAETTTTVDRRVFGTVREVSLWDLARGNPAVHGSAWYRALEARAREREKARKAKHLAEIERQRGERERLAEEAMKRERERLAALERQRKERERVAEAARSQQRKRLAEKAARIERERASCEPALGEIGTIGAWRTRKRVVAALKDDTASPLDAYAASVPFLLAGDGRHPEVEGALAARILRDVDRWWEAAVEERSKSLTAWTGVAAMLRENCLHDIADYVVVTVMFEDIERFRSIVFRETADKPERVHPDAIRALDHVPQGVLADVIATGSMRRIPRIVEAAAGEAAKPFVASCVGYYNAQSELRGGRGLTPVQRDAITGMCACIHDEARREGHVLSQSRFTDIVASATGLGSAFSRELAELGPVIARCAALHGRNLK